MLCLPQAHADAPHRIPILFHLAAPGGPTTEAFIAEQLDHANSIYAPLGITLVDAGRRNLPVHHANLNTRQDRDALLTVVRPGAIHCVVVSKLMDVDEPGRERRGVHWRARSGGARHLVIVSTISGPYVLAHELGHFLGNRAHSDTPGNLMSYTHGDGPPSLSDAQIARIHETLRRMLATRELRESKT